ncbi:MAG: hypothetical protein HeimC3_36980 [Candidatus Heimdallarchaeota archaeon LC_3]|nr:MAG: hypothetical protein HeimC3_36980 [Candidatus Heimdallarchaeota archaeon LC_3]
MVRRNKIPSRRIVVETDSWFNSKTMLDFLRQIKVAYRIDGKNNYGVQIPVRDAISKAQIQKKGRKRKHFVKYITLKEFFGSPEKWSKNTIKATVEIIYSRTATGTLKTGGRV